MTKQLTRRELLTAMAGGAVLTGCGVEERHVAAAPVSIVRAPAYDQSVYDTMLRMLRGQVGDVRGRNILLKPNLVEFEPGTCINTHPLVVHAAYEAFLALVPSHVRIAKRPCHRPTPR